MGKIFGIIQLPLFVCAFIINFGLSDVHSQTFSHKTYTTDNGLTYNDIQNITQDTTGFLWIATWDGLNRFDGYEFRNYYHRPNDSTTFPFFPVDKVLVDSLNNVWVLCSSRPIYRYNRAKDNFEKFDLLKDIVVFDITMDNHGDIWLLGVDQLYHYYQSEKRIEPVKILCSDNHEPFIDYYKLQLIFDNKNHLWLFDCSPLGSKLYKSTVQKNVLIEKEPFIDTKISNSNSFSLKHIHGNVNVFTTETKETWLFSKFGLFLLDTINRACIHKNDISNIDEFKSSPFLTWIDDDSGIHITEPKTGNRLIVPNQQGLYFDNMFMDKSADLWAATVSESRTNIGLMRFNEIPDNFNHYLTEPNEDGNINLIFPILKDKLGNVWVGSRTSRFLYKIKPDKAIEKIDIFKGFTEDNRPQVRSMVQDSTGIWFGCTNNYILFYDFKSPAFSTLNSKPLRINNNTSPLKIHNILKIGNRLVFSGWEGIYSYSIYDGKIQVEYSKAMKGSIFTITADKNNGLWLGSHSNTIIHLDSQFNETGVFKIGNEGNIVEHICLGDNNDLWVALMGGGLGHFVPSTGETEIFTTADGLPNNTLYSIIKDTHGNLWISTNKGLSQFNPKTKSFRNFSEAEGLNIEEFNSDAFFESDDGELFFGGVGGLVGFYPDSIYKLVNKYANGNLIISDFMVSGIERRFNKAIYDMDTLMLEKGENNFQFTFACIDFQNADKLKYRFRMEEVNNSWIETNYRNRNANYSNLVPGTYHFEVQCTNAGGEWTTSKIIVIQIPFYYYQTRWFRIFMAGIMFALIFLIASLIVRQIRLKEKQKHDELKLESLRGQMNPHFIFNALNSINYFISKNDKISANSYIADFSRLIRSILNNLSHDFIPFEDEIESLRDYLRLEHLRFSDKFNYELKIEPGNKTMLSVFPGLVQPFIENAIWHGVRGLEDRIGFIKVSFKFINSDMIRCIVEDDGIGRKQAEIFKNVLPGKKSRGIGIVTERLKIISEIRNITYKVTIEDLNPDDKETGTRVIIEIPCQHGTKNIE